MTTRNAPIVARARVSDPSSVYSRSRNSTRSRSSPRGRVTPRAKTSSLRVGARSSSVRVGARSTRPARSSSRAPRDKRRPSWDRRYTSPPSAICHPDDNVAKMTIRRGRFENTKRAMAASVLFWRNSTRRQCVQRSTITGAPASVIPASSPGERPAERKPHLSSGRPLSPGSDLAK